MKAILGLILLSPVLLFAQGKNPRLTPLVQAVNKVMPATVIIHDHTIDVEEINRSEAKLHLRKKSIGTGVIIDESGLVITNEHVIRGSKELSVFTFGNKSYQVRVVFKSRKEDLAILQILDAPEVKFQAVELAWPKDLYLGESVATVGNPLGLSFSISKGILSATQRKLEVGERVLYDNLLQTDIKVNPGNSGGPLINMEGKMIGMMVGSQTDSYGIGFAIPVEKIEAMMLRWLSPENQTYSTIGFRVETVFDKNKRKVRTVIKDLKKGVMNSQFGLKNKMSIAKVDGLKVNTALDFYKHLSNAKIGQQLTLTMAGGKTFNMQLYALEGLTLAKAKLGLEFQKLGPDIAQAMALPFDSGFVLSNIDSRYSNVKIRRGDMLFKVGNKIIMKDEDFQSLFTTLETGRDINVVFLRVNYDSGVSKVEVINDRIPVSLIQ